MPIQPGIIVVTLVAFLAQDGASQFPRLAPPPPCRAEAAATPVLSYWTGAARDSRPRVAIFPLQPDVDDAGRVYLAIALPERLRERLALEPRLRVATEGSVSRALTEARARTDSAARLLGADYVVTGKILILGDQQEVELLLSRAGRSEPVWRATFRATTSFRAIEESVVRGLSRALGLAAPPPMPRGWPTSDEAHAELLAGDAHMRAPSGAALDSAIVHYDRAFTQEPGSSAAALRLARASVTLLERGGTIPGYAGANGPRRVNELVDRSFTIDSTAEAWTIRAMLARAMDPVRFTGALNAHLRAVSLDPRSADAEHEYAVTLLRLGDSKGAETRFRRALALTPGRYTTLATLAAMQLQASHFDMACVLSNASIAAWPYDPLPYATRAEARLRLSDARDAYADAELVRRLATGAWPEALRVLIVNGSSNVDNARQLIMGLTAAWLAPGVELNVRDAEYLAMAYLAMGDQRRAVEALRRARPVGTDLRVALNGPRLAAIRRDTAIVRLMADSQGDGRPNPGGSR